MNTFLPIWEIAFFGKQILAHSHALSACGSEALFKASGIALRRFPTLKVNCTVKYCVIACREASKLKITVSRISHRHQRMFSVAWIMFPLYKFKGIFFFYCKVLIITSIHAGMQTEQHSLFWPILKVLMMPRLYWLTQSIMATTHYLLQ